MTIIFSDSDDELDRFSKSIESMDYTSIIQIPHQPSSNTPDAQNFNENSYPTNDDTFTDLLRVRLKPRQDVLSVRKKEFKPSIYAFTGNHYYGLSSDEDEKENEPSSAENIQTPPNIVLTSAIPVETSVKAAESPSKHVHISPKPVLTPSTNAHSPATNSSRRKTNYDSYRKKRKRMLDNIIYGDDPSYHPGWSDDDEPLTPRTMRLRSSRREHMRLEKERKKEEKKKRKIEEALKNIEWSSSDDDTLAEITKRMRYSPEL